MFCPFPVTWPQLQRQTCHHSKWNEIIFFNKQWQYNSQQDGRNSRTQEKKSDADVSASLQVRGFTDNRFMFAGNLSLVSPSINPQTSLTSKLHVQKKKTWQLIYVNSGISGYAKSHEQSEFLMQNANHSLKYLFFSWSLIVSTQPQF